MYMATEWKNWCHTGIKKSKKKEKKAQGQDK